MRDFTDTEIQILRRVQTSLPDSVEPFADIARDVGCSPDEVIGLLRRLKAEGAIRRFGATLKHQKAGYAANVMVAWRIDDPDEINRVGELLAEQRQISHCYHRPAPPSWPYNLYTMVHGRSREECLETVEALKRLSGVADCQLLFSTRELKKTSMHYFS